MSKLRGKALVAQGGGPTAVINQSLVGVILEARKFSEISRVYGARFGVRGILNEDFFDLSQSTTHNLEQVGNTPGAALGSTRDKPDQTYCEKMFEVMKRNDIRYFYYIGGNDSAETCRIVNEAARSANYELRVVHIPKTIDNDLLVTDHCPGFGSAGKYIAQAFTGVNLDNASLPGVYLGIVMGRNAGFLTASSALAKRFSDDGPHLIYLPEKAFNSDRFVADVERTYKMYGRCVVALSEGICDENGEPIAGKILKQKEFDAHGNMQLSGSGALGDLLSDLIKQKTGIKRVRSDTLGYIQRSFLGCVSEVDKHEAREVGERAVQYSVWDDIDGSVVIKRVGDYAVSYDLVKLEAVAGRVKKMPEEYILGNNMVTEAFKNYMRPLVGSVPVIDRLSAPRVKKNNNLFNNNNMAERSLNETAKLLVAKEKGILAADESSGTISKRFASIGVESTEENRRAYRELLFTAPEIEKYISGVILFDETLRQSTKDGISFPQLLASRGIIPGIKVDKGTKDLDGAPGEVYTEGLDGLAERTQEYYNLGARFAKWRAVIKIGVNIPTDKCIEKNAEILAKYAKICQESKLVPIVEPEVLMEGDHSIGRCYEVTKKTLLAVFAALEKEKVDLSGMLLKPNMVIYSLKGGKVPMERVAEMTLECFREAIPAAVPGIVFLSGGQSEPEACESLNAINALAKNEPWELSYSYGRALQNTALKTWGGNAANTKSAQAAFLHRAKLVSAARSGKYLKDME